MNTSTVMTRDVVVVSPTVTAGIAARMMERRRIRHLPVVEAAAWWAFSPTGIS